MRDGLNKSRIIEARSVEHTQAMHNRRKTALGQSVQGQVLHIYLEGNIDESSEDDSV